MVAPWAHPSWAQALPLNLNGAPDNGGSRYAAFSFCKQSGGVTIPAVNSGILRRVVILVCMPMLSSDMQGVGGAERRVWKAGQTPFHPRRSPSSEPMAIEGPPTAQPASREPLPMTESARRIAMALDAMLPVRKTPFCPMWLVLGVVVIKVLCEASSTVSMS